MHIGEQPTAKRAGLPIHLTAALALLAVAALPGAAHAQWTTSGNNISNTNTGNVGVGTGASAPAGKLDVKGDTSDTTATALNVRNSLDANLLFVRNDGKVGIGTTTPLAVFHVARGDASTGAAAFFQKDSSSGGVALGTTNGIGFMSGANYNYTASTDLLINPFGGNVGVGTNAPAVKLDVAGNGRFSGAGAGLSVNNTNGWTQFVATRTGAMQAAFIAVPSVAYSVNSPYWAMGLSADGSAGWSLDTWDGANLITRMRMLPGGDLGIGTTSPSSARLHLYSPANTYLRIGAPLANQSSIAFNDDSNGQDIVLYRPESTRDFVVWTATAGNAMRVMQSGSVGVGTNTPGYKFDVQGGQINVSGGLCIAGDCKTAWSQVGGSSQWTTSGSNIYFSSGSVGIGTQTPTHTLEVAGTINASGAITGGTINATYQDVAEWVPSSQKLSAGTVVVLDGEHANHVLASTTAYDTAVAGVVSERPGIALGEGGEGKLLVATTGRVKVRVDATHAPIKVGDLLVTSDKEGVAMKSIPVDLGGTQIHRPGTIIGKALEPLANGRGEILVLLSLQ